MRLHLSGEDIPKALFELIAATTDHARLNFREVQYDEAKGVVILPILRFPLLKQRQILGNLHDYKKPLKSEIIIHNVESCEIRNIVEGERAEDVVLLFGLTVRGNEIFVSSVEEDRGRTCFFAQMAVNGIDIEICDASAVERD